jgi:hypothetical protein
MITHDWDVSYHHATKALLLQREVVGFGPPEVALSEVNVRRAFGHVGHHHPVLAGLACAGHSSSGGDHEHRCDHEHPDGECHPPGGAGDDLASRGGAGRSC